MKKKPYWKALLEDPIEKSWAGCRVFPEVRPVERWAVERKLLHSGLS
jgi:hypothetical protein